MAMAEHKEKALGPHFVFSIGETDHLDKDELKLSHKDILRHLVGAGYDAHEVSGHDKSPKKYIIVYGVNQKDAEQLHKMVGRMGQSCSVYSTGKQHEKRYHHGSDAGKKVTGEGVIMHKNRPSDNYISLPGEQNHFTHQFMSKSEDSETYRKMAESGMDLLFPTSIRGKEFMSDTGIVYHITIKLFEPKTDDPKKIDEIASKLELIPPSLEDTSLEFSTIKGRNGNTMYVIELHGPTADRIIQYHQEFKDIGNPMSREFQPHVTIEKPLWDELKGSGAKTAKEAGLKFGPAELRQGNRILYSYRPKSEKLAPSKKEEASQMKEEK